MPDYIVALGTNARGEYGEPDASLDAVITFFEDQPWVVKHLSRRCDTAPVSPLRQPRYVNLVAVVAIPLPPARVLHLVKRFERRAGRIRVRSRGPRPIDIDIVDCAGWQLGWNRPARKSGPRGAAHRRGPRPHLMLPHPLAHTRAFVLDPLADVAPHWWHRGLRAPLSKLRHALRRPPGLVRMRSPGTVGQHDVLGTCA